MPRRARMGGSIEVCDVGLRNRDGNGGIIGATTVKWKAALPLTRDHNVAKHIDPDDDLDSDEFDKEEFDEAPVRELPSVPLFCKVVFIGDALFCTVRLIFVLVTVFSFLVTRDVMGGAERMTAPFEIVTGLAIVLCGLTANLLMLVKKSWAVGLGYLLLVVTLASIGVELWKGFAQLTGIGGGDPAKLMASWIFAAVSAVFRSIVLIAYATA